MAESENSDQVFSDTPLNSQSNVLVADAATVGEQYFVDMAQRIRRHVLMMTSRAGSSHVGSNFSMVELLAVLYGEVLRVDASNPQWPARDRFILSKGHACASLYAVLAEHGFFPIEWLDTFYQNGSLLAGHATCGIPGIEVSTGSLGHGLSIGVGMALAAQRSAQSQRVFTLLSDGECNEGAVWEAALSAAHHRLANVIAIIDYNKIQAMGAVKDVLALEPFAAKWQAFGWAVREIDGHDVAAIRATFRQLPFEAGRPNCVIAHTIKGKGVSFMEHNLLWHYRTPRGDELAAALAELER